MNIDFTEIWASSWYWLTSYEFTILYVEFTPIEAISIAGAIIFIIQIFGDILPGKDEDT